MRKKISIKNVLIMVVLCTPISLLIPYVAFSLYEKITLGGASIGPVSVESQYQDAFDATVAVWGRPIDHPWLPNQIIKPSATGIILNTGYIITNKHVVDTDADGEVSNKEKKVKIVLSDTTTIHSGTVIYSSEGPWSGKESIDFAIISVPNLPQTNVHFMSNDDYRGFLAGRPVFSIGRSMGIDPAHFVRGIRSTDFTKNYHRASIGTFFGNSGGGLFSEETGEIIGITSRIQIDRGIVVPSWTEYLHPIIIRKELQSVGLGHVIDKKTGESNNYMLLLLIPAGVLILYGIKEYKTS